MLAIRGSLRRRSRLSHPAVRGSLRRRSRLSHPAIRGSLRRRSRLSHPAVRGSLRRRLRLSHPAVRGSLRRRSRLSHPAVRGSSRRRSRSNQPTVHRRLRHHPRLTLAYRPAADSMPAGLPLTQTRRIAADSSSPDCRWLMPAGRPWQGKPTHFLSSRRRLRLTDPAVRGRSRRRPWGKPTHRRRLPLFRGESQPAVRGSLGPQPAEAPSSPPAPAVEWSSQPAAAVIVKPAGYGLASRLLPNLTSQQAVAVFDQSVTTVFLTVSVCLAPEGSWYPWASPRNFFWGGG